MQFRVLGPLEVECDGHQVEVVTPMQRDLLGVLLVNANHVVSTDRLVDALWEGDRGGRTSTLHVHMSNLRKALDTTPDEDHSPIVTRSPGYVLNVSPDEVDAARFEVLVAHARRLRETDPDEALHAFDEALELWRGPAFADFEYRDWAQAAARRLNELRAEAVEDRLDLLLSARSAPVSPS